MKLPKGLTELRLGWGKSSVRSVDEARWIFIATYVAGGERT